MQKYGNILNKKMDFLGKNIDYFATIEIPTLSRNCFGESPTSFLKDVKEV